jgi:hypothetical protein
MITQQQAWGKQSTTSRDSGPIELNNFARFLTIQHADHLSNLTEEDP